MSQGCPGAQVAVLSSQTARSLSQPEECGLRPKDMFRECANCPEMVVVPAGDVLMGSSARDIDSGLAAANEGPPNTGRSSSSRSPSGASRSHAISMRAFVKSSGYKPVDRCYTFEQNQPREREPRSFLNPGFAQDGNHPAVCVSWMDANAYVQWLSQNHQQALPAVVRSGVRVCRARRKPLALRLFSTMPPDLCKFVNGADRAAKAAGLPADAPYMNCSDGYPFTAPVGSLAANAFGLSDMIGNVWEWTKTVSPATMRPQARRAPPASRPAAPPGTVRGGDWFSNRDLAPPSVRAKANADAHHDDIGFRVARTLGP